MITNAAGAGEDKHEPRRSGESQYFEAPHFEDLVSLLTEE